jgi:hypothetical protein
MTVPVPQNPAAPQGDPAAQQTAQPQAPATAPALGSMPQPPAPTQPVEPAKVDEPLGAGGMKALEAEREARKALEAELKALAPLKELAAKFGAVPAAEPKDDTADRMAALEKQLAEERDTRLRLEVAAEKSLTPQQAARLAGTSKEELLADADALLALFPASSTSDGQPQGQPTGPKPDPSQGARGPVDLDAQIADAEAKGETMRAIGLKRQKMLTSRT